MPKKTPIRAQRGITFLAHFSSKHYEETLYKCLMGVLIKMSRHLRTSDSWRNSKQMTETGFQFMRIDVSSTITHYVVTQSSIEIFFLYKI